MLSFKIAYFNKLWWASIFTYMEFDSVGVHSLRQVDIYNIDTKQT